MTRLIGSGSDLPVRACQTWPRIRPAPPQQPAHATAMNHCIPSALSARRVTGPVEADTDALFTKAEHAVGA